MPDISDIVGGFAAGIADGASQIGGEFKKVGHTVVSQVTGSPPSAGSHDDSSIKEAAGKLAGANDDNNSVWGEFKKIGKSVSAQVSGDEDVGGNALSEMTKKDKDFSKTEYAAVRAKVQQIYQEYEAKKKKEEAMRKQAEEVHEQQKEEMEELSEEKKKDEFVNPAIQKARAEIKNYGSE